MPTSTRLRSPMPIGLAETRILTVKRPPSLLLTHCCYVVQPFMWRAYTGTSNWVPPLSSPPRARDGPPLPRGEQLPSDGYPPPRGGGVVTINEHCTAQGTNANNCFFFQTTMSWLSLQVVRCSRRLLTLLMCHDLVPHRLSVKLLGPGPLPFEFLNMFTTLYRNVLGSTLRQWLGLFRRRLCGSWSQKIFGNPLFL